MDDNAGYRRETEARLRKLERDNADTGFLAVCLVICVFVIFALILSVH